MDRRFARKARPCLHRWFAIVLPLVLAATGHGELIFDPEPSMSWDDLIACEWVFTATYVSHEGELGNHNSEEAPASQKLTLTVGESLKGDLKTGQNVTLRLDHWYGVVTRPVGFFEPTDAKDDGVPRLVYQAQLVNPGGLQPVELKPDLRKPSLFFVRNAQDPFLKRAGQVHATRFASEWRKALNREEPGQFFLIQQAVDPERRMHAIDRLDRERDPAVLEALFGELSFPENAERTMAQLTDVDGWIFERAKRGIEHPPAPPAEIAHEFSGDGQFERTVRSAYARVMARAAPGRALQQAKEWLNSDSPEMRGVAFELLAWNHTAEALELAVELASQPETANEALRAIRWILLLPFRDDVSECGALAAPVWTDLMALLDLPAEHWATTDPKQGESNRFALRIIAEIRDQKTPEVSSETGLSPEDLYVRYHPDTDLLESFPRDPGFNLGSVSRWLKHPFPAERGRRLSADPACVAEVRRVVDELLAGRVYGADYESLELYHWLAPGEANEAMDVLLRGRANLARGAQRELLRAAVRCGRTELGAELIAVYRLTDREREDYGTSDPELVRTGYFDLLALLEAGTQEGVEEYLRLLDQKLETPAPPRYGGQIYPPLYSEHAQSLDLRHLFPRYPKQFFDRVVRLLQSAKLIDRQRAVRAMDAALHWHGTTGFDPERSIFDPGEDPPIGHRRDQLLARLVPVLERMGQMESELEIRAETLRQIGLDLEGEPGPAWYPELVDAVGSLAPPSVVNNAMRLSELLVRDAGPTTVDVRRKLRPADRALYLQFFFIQH